MRNNVNQTFYNTLTCSTKLVEYLDELEEHKVLRKALKVKARVFKKELENHLNNAFEKGGKTLTDIFDQDALLESKVKELDTPQRLAVYEFVERLLKEERDYLE